MPTVEEESQLEQTKMSFGEHLEELRAALIKSILAIVIGFLLGLIVGRQLVDYIQVPLRAALKEFYVGQAVNDVKESLEQKKAQGQSVPDDIDAAAKEFAKEDILPLEVWIDRRDLADAWRELYPNAGLPPKLADDLAELSGGAPPKRNDMLQLRVYRPADEDERLKIIATGTEEPFFIFIKASLVAGLIISSPFVFFFIWEFVAAGLYKQEKKYVYVFLPISLGLFLSGAALAFYIAIDFVLKFLLQFFDWMGIEPNLRINEWMSFVLMLPLGFGISFQLPLVMLFLERLGIVSIEAYVSKWRIAVLVIAIISMFLTPADPGSMIVMATPLTGLYFLGIAMCKYFPKSFAPQSPRQKTGDPNSGADSAGS